MIEIYPQSSRDRIALAQAALDAAITDYRQSAEAMTKALLAIIEYRIQLNTAEARPEVSE